MPPSPLSLLWPTMLMPKKLYFSVLLRNQNRVNAAYTFIKKKKGIALLRKTEVQRGENIRSLQTHVKSDSDDV